jgi:hypothetical protein
MMSLGLPRSNDTFSKLLSSSVGCKCISKYRGGSMEVTTAKGS